jgi:2-C-methyl-D-erythritol 4-phosphate cytidylyltransferase
MHDPLASLDPAAADRGGTGLRVWAVVPAAGGSRRFGDRDKLAEDLGGRPLLVRTVECLSRREEVRGIIVAGPPADTPAGRDFRDRFGPTLAFHGVRIVDGGREHRWESVRSALAEVPEEATHVAVHDAARPAVDDGLLDRVFAAARRHQAVIPGVPVTATLKRAGAPEILSPDGAADLLADAILGDAGRADVAVRPVLGTIDRSDLWAVQTPQVFTVDVLRRAFDEADPAGVTDDAELVQRLGEPVHLVEGSSTNVKVTIPSDLPLVRAILASMPRRPATL